MVIDYEGRYKINTNNKNKIIIKNNVLYLFEWTKYSVVVKGAKEDVKVHIGDEILKDRCKVNGITVIPFEIRSYIGRTKIKIFESDREISFSF